MTSIYIKEQGAKVRRRGERLVVSKGNAVIESFPLANVEQVTLMGNVQLTTQATTTLLEREIDVVFLSSFGKFRGRLTGSGAKQAHLRQAQLRQLGDKAVALTVARAIVVGKVHNQRVVLQRQKRRPTIEAHQEAQYQKALQGMIQMRRSAEQASSIESVRGYEGKAAAFYFAAIRAAIDPAWQFERRAYYPPPDPFNALLSFVYSLLLRDVTTAVHQVGFDAYIGCFHEVAYGRPSLVLDLMAEWRPLIGDALVLELVNRGGLSPDDFRWTGNVRRPVELSEQGIELVLRSYGMRLDQKLYHADAGPGGETTLRHAILLQVRRLAQFVLGKRASYEPVMAK